MDPLRAGHVAALEGRGFRYFCHASCKQDFLRANGRPQEEDVPTAAPPEVAYALEALNDANGHRTTPPPSSAITPRVTLPSLERAPRRGRSAYARGRARRHELGPAVGPVGVAGIPRASVFGPVRGPRARGVSVGASATPARRRPSGRPAAERADAAPGQLRRAARAPWERRSESATAVIDGLGIVAGVLAPAIGLLGAVADVARVPLVVFAWAALARARCALAPRSVRPAPARRARPGGRRGGGGVVGAGRRRSAGGRDRRARGAGVCRRRSRSRRPSGARAIACAAAREAVERALDVRVRAIQGDDAIELPASDVRPGEQVVVEAGEVVGVDADRDGRRGARRARGSARSVEVARREGDPLVAGARVVSSRLRMTTTWSGRERAWVKLLSVPAARIDVAAPTARVLRHTVERGVPVAALLVGMATMATNATPVEILAAMSAAAMAFGAKALVSLVALHFARAHLEALASGITYKDPRAFERAGSANIAVLSARGTVLLGEPEIVAVEPIGARGRESEAGDGEVARVLSLAAGAETASTHPFAAAILRAARTRAARADDVRNATVHAGLGVTALASTGERLVVGGRAIMLSEKIGVAAVDDRVTELEGQGRSVLLVALGDRLVGLISLQDGLRAGARAAVQRLLDARIEPVLLSGEARDTCETIGRALDIEHVRPAVLPADRGPEVRALGEGGNVVAVIGHPVSDDGALGAADVAVAMGAAGSTPGRVGRRARERRRARRGDGARDPARDAREGARRDRARRDARPRGAPRRRLRRRAAGDRARSPPSSAPSPSPVHARESA